MIRFNLISRFTFALTALTQIWCVVKAEDSVRHVDRPDSGENAYAVGNKAPLAQNAFWKLPIGAIRPEGWVRKQLELEADGFIGHLTEISPWLDKKNNAWLSPTGQGTHGWEEVPYWLKGFGDLGYVLNDKRIQNEAKIWVEGVLSSQRANGYFGPESNLTANNGKPDVWPNMVMLNALQSYYEFSSDKRVLDLMGRYFKWEMTIPDPDFLLSYWEPQRAGDNIASVVWLYNRTGESSLFELIEKLHRKSARWDEGVPDWHGVNMAQGFREPAEYFALKKSPSLLEATEYDYAQMRRQYGQVPGGLYGADENARPGFSDPRQAAETCAMVEMMLSHERLLTISGDPVWAERCEDVAFNSLPASMTPDLKALHYLTSPNMVLLDKKSKSPGLQNGGPMLLFNAYDHRCCQHNVSHGWPYYAEHLWLGSANNGLAAVLFAPSQVTAKVGDGTPVTIHEETRYPFEETVTFSFKTAKPNRFPLSLRWPSWCTDPELKINGKVVKLSGSPGGYLIVERTWANNDRLVLHVPMKVVTRTWSENKNAVSVERGPLTYSLNIGEKYVREGGTDAFPAWEVHPTTQWNYGLDMEELSVKIVKRQFPSDDQPFIPQKSPVEILVKGRQIPNWQIDHLGLVGLLQESPARTNSPLETISLIPMGAARLRITSFPTVGITASAIDWKAPAKRKNPIPAAASHVFSGDSLDALSDGVIPSSSSDQDVPRFTWWNHQGTTEWVQYEFKDAKPLSRIRVYWFDDEPSGGKCRVPASWKLLVKEGSGWKEVKVHGSYGVEKNAFNTVEFDPEVNKIFRIEVQLQPGVSGGILEWEIQ